MEELQILGTFIAGMLIGIPVSLLAIRLSRESGTLRELKETVYLV